MTPGLTRLRQDDTHRLIPTHLSESTVLERLADSVDQLQGILDLDSATNDRLLGEANLLPGISVHELLFGVENAHVVNAAFTHAHPEGGRFNGPDRGAWYAAFEVETARAEVEFHKLEELREIGWEDEETFVFDDYLADFRSEFHDIRRKPAFASALNPSSYAASQELAAGLLAAGSAGIVYPSLRRPRGTCIVCFRPALVTHVRKGKPVTMRLRANVRR